MRIKRYVATLVLAMLTSSLAAAATVAIFVQHSVGSAATVAVDSTTTPAPDVFYDM